MAPLSDHSSFAAAPNPPSMIFDGWSWGSKKEVEKIAEDQKEAETLIPTGDLESKQEEKEALTPTGLVFRSRAPINPEKGPIEYIYIHVFSGEWKEAAGEPPKMMIEVCIDEMVEDVKVDQVVVRGNTKTKDRFIERVLHRKVNKATTQDELIDALVAAYSQFNELGVFDSIRVRVLEGAPSFVDLIVDLKEAPCDAFDLTSWFSRPTDPSWSIGFGLAKRNLLGQGQLGHVRLACGPYRWELLTSLFLPVFRGVEASAFFRAHDWKEISSYKEQTCGVDVNIGVNQHHQFVYNLGWRQLTDPSQMASESIRRQLGNHLLSSLNYKLTLGLREPLLTLTPGYSLVASTRIGGLAPGNWSSRFLRQELDFRFRVPIGVAALNVGVHGGVILPWGNDFLKKPTSLPERFFLGGDCYLPPTLGGFWGFKNRGIGPSEPRRHVSDICNGKNSESCGRDFVGGDLAVSAFAHMSFGLPFRWLKEQGAYGHVFANSGNVTKLAEDEFRNFSFQGFVNAFRTSVGLGIVIPIGPFYLQCNYIHTVNQFKHDAGKAGFQISISTLKN